MITLPAGATTFLQMLVWIPVKGRNKAIWKIGYLERGLQSYWCTTLCKVIGAASISFKNQTVSCAYSFCEQTGFAQTQVKCTLRTKGRALKNAFLAALQGSTVSPAPEWCLDKSCLPCADLFVATDTGTPPEDSQLVTSCQQSNLTNCKVPGKKK